MGTGIIFNSVKAFVEQVGRRLQWRYAELDNMVCVYVGPQASALQFKPKINSPHPDYPLMFVTDSEITNHEAGVAEVSVTYHGIIQTSGQSPYYTPPVITETGIQGARDFQLPYISQLSAPVYQQLAGPGGALTSQSVMVAPPYYAYGTQNVNVRYMGTQVSIRYQAHPKPKNLVYSSLGLGLVNWHIISQYYGQVSIAGQWVEYGYAVKQVDNIPHSVPPILAINTGFSKQQRGQWYDCTETYAPTF